MKLENQNILFFLRASQHGGTENVVLQLCEILEHEVNKIVVCSTDGFDKELLKILNIKHYMIPDIELKDNKTIEQVFKIVYRIIVKENISIVHTHHRMAAFYTYILSYFKKIIFINTSHNTFTDKKILTKMMYKKAHLIACGEIVKKNLVEEYRLSPERITVIHNATKPFKEEVVQIPKLLYWKMKGYSLVANVGRLSEQKGMKYFIEAIPNVKKNNPNIKYIIVGDGDERNILTDLSKELNLEDDIIFLGYRNDIKNIMSQVDFLVLSSLWEGFPLAPIEAFAVGKTVIATAVDGTVEIISDGKNGFLVPAKDSGNLSKKIIELINNLELRQSFEDAALETYYKNFSFDKYAIKIIQFYNRIILEENV